MVWTLLYYLILTVFIVGSLLLTGIVLLQRPKSEGLGSAFGGNITENMFGSQTTDVLTKFTIYLGSAFFVATLLLAMLTAKIQRESVESNLIKQAISHEEKEPQAQIGNGNDEPKKDSDQAVGQEPQATEGSNESAGQTSSPEAMTSPDPVETSAGTKPTSPDS